MNTRASLQRIAASLIAVALFAGCKSTEPEETAVSGGVYYGVGHYDTWYYGPDDYPPEIIVTPPDKPDDSQPKPEHPIVLPPSVEQPIAKPPTVAPTPAPTPSIPSMPRPMPRPATRR